MPERTALKVFEIVVTESGKQIAEKRFFNRLNLFIQELIDRHGLEKVLDDKYLEDPGEFRPILTLNDPLQVRMCWFDNIVYQFLGWLNPDDAYSLAKAQATEEAGEIAAWKATNTGKQIKKRRRYYRYVR